MAPVSTTGSTVIPGEAFAWVEVASQDPVDAKARVWGGTREIVMLGPDMSDEREIWPVESRDGRFVGLRRFW